MRAGPARRERKRRDRRRARDAAITAHRGRHPLTARLLGDPLPGRSALDLMDDRSGKQSVHIPVRIVEPAESDLPIPDDLPDDPDDLQDFGF